MSLEDYLREVVSILREDYPSEFQRMLDLLASDSILIGVDDEKIMARVREGQVQFSNPRESRSVDLESLITRSLMFELLDGNMSLAEAILKPEFMIRGSPEAILRFHKIVEIILLISQRSASFIDLLNRFRYE